MNIMLSSIVLSFKNFCRFFGVCTVHCTLQFLIKLAYLPSFSINGMAFCGFTPRYTQALKDRQVSSAATFFLDFSSDCTTSLICIYAITYLVCQNICEALDSIKFISWKCHFLICYLK